MGERSGAPRASALHQSSFRNLRLRFNYRSQMSQIIVTHPSSGLSQLATVRGPQPPAHGQISGLIAVRPRGPIPGIVRFWCGLDFAAECRIVVSDWSGNRRSQTIWPSASSSAAWCLTRMSGDVRRATVGCLIYDTGAIIVERGVGIFVLV